MYKVVKIEITDDIYVERCLLKTHDLKKAIAVLLALTFDEKKIDFDTGYFIKDKLDEFVDWKGIND